MASQEAKFNFFHNCLHYHDPECNTWACVLRADFAKLLKGCAGWRVGGKAILYHFKMLCSPTALKMTIVNDS